MSASIDQRIVEMKFDNAQFEAGVRTTLSSLEALEKGMKLDGAAKGLANASKGMNQLTETGKKFSIGGIGGIGGAVESVSQKFQAMTVIGITALAALTTKAVAAGVTMAKGMFGPIQDGMQEYETNLNAIQTILANTSAAGTNLKQVNAALQELNTYSDQTIYNFSEMARNIGTFTAAGVDLKTATGSIKGIANLAALSGSNSQQASTAMYQLSQAISSGKVSLMDWNSVVNAGMGGAVFQRALAQTAEKMGTLDKGAVKLKGSMKNVTIGGKSFRESITAKPGEQSWLTSDVLTKTLNQFTGDLTNAQLKAQGFSDAQIKAIQKQAKMAKDAATQVKTFTQLIGTVKESMGSGWANTWQLVFGNFDEAKKMWTDVNNVIGGIVGRSAKARNDMLQAWRDNGGRDAMIAGVKNAFQALESVVKPIKDAFRQIFPPTTGKQLADITKAIRDFLDKLKMGAETADKVKRLFAGVFAIFDIGWEVIKQVARIFVDLFKAMSSDSSSKLLEMGANFGDFLVHVHDLVKNGKGLTSFFDKVRGAIERLAAVKNVVSDFIENVLGRLAAYLSNVDLSGIDAKLEPLRAMGVIIEKVWSNVIDHLDDVWGTIGGLGDKFADMFKSIGEGFSNFFGPSGGGGIQNFATLFQTGLLAILIKSIHDFLKDMRSAADEFSGVVSTITSPFEALTKTLETMQGTLRAATLLQIAAAVGILTLSVIALSKIDEKGLKRALAGMTVMFIQLSVAMAIFQKIEIKSGMLQLIALATAIRILADAVKILGELNLIDLMQGLYGVTFAIGLLVAAARLMPDGKKMISSSVGLVILASAVKILASAIKDLSGLSWEEISKGLVGVGAVLTGLILFTKFAKVNKGGIAQGAGLILLATGVKILASAMKDFTAFSWDDIGRGLVAMGGGIAIMAAALNLIPPSSVLSAAAVLIVASSLGMLADALGQMSDMKWEEIGKGLVTMGGALGLIATALSLMPPTSIISAAAIFVVVASLGLLTNSLQKMGDMGWGEIAKGLIVLAGALTIIAVAVTAMVLALPGAVALTIVVAALAIFLPLLALMGQMSWAEIAKGMVVLAGALTIIGVAGALLTPVIPTLMGLGIAIGLLGAGMALAGLGLLAFSAGLTALAISGAAGTAAIVAIVAGLIGLIPQVMQQIGLGIIAFAQVIATSGPAITLAITTVLMALMNSIIIMTPKIISTMLVMLAGLLRALVVAVPMMVSAGMRLIVGVLSGIAANIGKVISKAADVIVAFLKGIAKEQPRVVDQAAKTIIAFINGVADAIRNNSSELGAAGGNMATAIVEGMVKGIGGGVASVVGAAKRMAKSALDAAKSALGIHSPSKEFEKVGKFSGDGFAKGLTGNKAAVTASYNSMKSLLKTAMAESAKDMQTAKERLAKLTKARHKDAAAIKKAKLALAQATAENKKSSAAYRNLTHNLVDERNKLQSLANSYDSVTKKLDAAKKTLADATKVRDDYNKTVTDQYDNLPDIADDTKLPDYIADLEKQVTDTQLFTAQLQKLRDLGLNDDMYKQLLGKGTAAMPFVEQILEGGKNSVDQLNTIGSALDKSAAALGSTASKALYQAAVDSAAGLVKGLESQQANIEKQMDKIAGYMVRAIKKSLGIKSPSREFMKIGVWSNEGLAKGLEDSTAAVDAAENVGHNAINAMRKTLTGLGDIVNSEVVDVNPTIKPVLDLSEVRKGAGQIEGMMPVKPLEVSGAYSQAAGASLAVKQRQAQDYDAQAQGSGDTLIFNQNNYSPKAISATETYRNTNNQLSRAKGALKRR